MFWLHQGKVYVGCSVDQHWPGELVKSAFDAQTLGGSPTRPGGEALGQSRQGGGYSGRVRAAGLKLEDLHLRLSAEEVTAGGSVPLA